MKLREWRKSKGLTQAQLAELWGVSRQSVVNYERERHDPRRRIPQPAELERLLEISGGGVTPNDFYELPVRRLAVEIDRREVA